MAGVGIAIVYMNVTLSAVVMGMNYALSVLIPIAYGQNDHKECEILLTRGRFIAFLLFIPCV